MWNWYCVQSTSGPFLRWMLCVRISLWCSRVTCTICSSVEGRWTPSLQSTLLSGLSIAKDPETHRIQISIVCSPNKLFPTAFHFWKPHYFIESLPFIVLFDTKITCLQKNIYWILLILYFVFKPGLKYQQTCVLIYRVTLQVFSRKHCLILLVSWPSPHTAGNTPFC